VAVRAGGGEAQERTAGEAVNDILNKKTKIADKTR
jgi:hypothetical protein